MFPVIKATRSVAFITFTITWKSIPTFFVNEMNLSGVVVRGNLTVRRFIFHQNDGFHKM